MRRDYDFKGAASVDQILDTAKGTRGTDEDGLRAEFIRLVKFSRSLRSLAKSH